MLAGASETMVTPEGLLHLPAGASVTIMRFARACFVLFFALLFLFYDLFLETFKS